MTTSSTAAPGSKRHGRVLLAAFGLLALITSSVFWYVASPTLGPIYDALRTIETAGLWRLTNWSQAIRSVPRGQPHDFLTIYVSSIPFGLFISVLIATIAAVAYDKRRVSINENADSTRSKPLLISGPCMEGSDRK